MAAREQQLKQITLDHFGALNNNAVQSADRKSALDRAAALPVPAGLGALAGGNAPASPPAPTPRPPPSVLNAREDRTPAGARGGSGASPTDQVETYLNTLQKQVATLKAEAETYGKSNIEKAKAVDLARALEAARQRGTPLTEAETAAVNQLAEAEGRAKDKLAALQQQQEQQRDQAQFFGNTLVDALESATQKGATFQSVMQGVVRSLEQAALKALVLGEGPLAGLFGSAPAPGATGSNAVGGIFGLLSKSFGFGASAGAGSAASAASAVIAAPFATGGAIRGPGSGRSDSILVRASNGEYIVNAAAAARHGPLLDALNKGAIPAFADGGFVGVASARSATQAFGGGNSAAAFHDNSTVNIMPAGGVSREEMYSALSRTRAESRKAMMADYDERQRRQKVGR